MPEANRTALTKLYYSKNGGTTKTQIPLVQEVPVIKTTPEPITYSAVDIDEERQVKGIRKAETIEIQFIYSEEVYKNLKLYEDDGEILDWYLQLPSETSEEDQPLTYSWRGDLSVALDAISQNDVIKAKLTIYKKSSLTESYGFPSNG